MMWLLLVSIGLTIVTSTPDAVVVQEQASVGSTVYAINSPLPTSPSTNETSEYEYTWSDTNSTPVYFSLQTHSGVISLAKSVAGLAERHFLLSVNIYVTATATESRRLVSVFQVEITVSKAVVCPRTNTSATVDAQATLGAAVLIIQCIKSFNLTLDCAIDVGSTLGGYFAAKRRDSGCFLYVNQSVSRLVGRRLTGSLVVTLDGNYSSEVNETVQISVTVEGPPLVTCRNATIFTSTALKERLRINLAEYCFSTNTKQSYSRLKGRFNVSENGIALVEGSLEKGTYQVVYRVDSEGITATGQVDIVVQTPEILPKNKTIKLLENVKTDNLFDFRANGFPSNNITFALEPLRGLPFRLTSNKTDVKLVVEEALDYDDPNQVKIYSFRIVGMNELATASAAVSVRLVNVNDNAPLLTKKDIIIPTSVHLNESFASIEWEDKDSTESTVIAELSYTTDSSTSQVIRPNPFQIKENKNLLLANAISSKICCYELHMTLSDYGFPGGDPSVIGSVKRTTYVLTAKRNSSQCTDCSIPPTEGLSNEVKYAIIAGSTGCFLLFLLIVATVVFWRRATNKQQRLDQILLNEIIPQCNQGAARSTVSRQPSLPTVYEDSDETDDDTDREDQKLGNGSTVYSKKVEPQKLDIFWAIPRRNLRIGYVIKTGPHAEVYYGKVIGLRGKDKADAALKTLKANASDEDKRLLVEELDIMKSTLRHPNVIRFYGACMMDNEPLRLVYEFAPHGNLLDFLRKIRIQETHATPPTPSESFLTPKISSVTASELLTFGLQIAKGMHHLNAMGRVHGSLTARKVLVGNGHVMKISGFGLARWDQFQQRKTLKSANEESSPVKWMALELFNSHAQLTSQADVWSYGILLWEIASLGRSPYQEVPLQEISTQLKRGYRMEKPDNCSDGFYKTMRDCWAAEPSQRPSFKELVRLLQQLLTSSADYLIMETNEPEGTFTNPLYEPDGNESKRDIDSIVRQLDQKISELTSII
eukprot:m.56364 g.56364  ORF g.56364 m.56364 type:complete len:990 (+) comp34590_c0_seq1:57-3026(+)